jgi:hypothetical protein
MSEIYITTTDQLKREAHRTNGDFVDFQIVLAGGLATSSKRISYRKESREFLIINEIDESYQEVHENDLKKKTLIVRAMENNCLLKL